MGREEERMRDEISPGTLYILILKTLGRRGEMHGYGTAEHVQQTSEGVLQVEERYLYPHCNEC
jgi:PadR family transcriptional regulator PadR